MLIHSTGAIIRRWFHQHGADQPGDAGLVGENTNQVEGLLSAAWYGAALARAGGESVRRHRLLEDLPRCRSH